MICYRGLVAGALVAAGLVAPAHAQIITSNTFAANPASLGPIPDGLGSASHVPGAPRNVTFSVTGITLVQRVSVSMRFNPAHTYGGEVTATLIAPDGTSHVIFGRKGATGDHVGSNQNLSGPYVFNDRATLNFWTDLNVTIAPGSYRTSASGGHITDTGRQTLMDPIFYFRGGNGTWTLRFVDGFASETGSVSAASLTLTPLLPPTGVSDAYATPFQTPLVVAAPGVLANDLNPPGNGPLSASLETAPQNGDVLLLADGRFTYAPSIGFSGTDTFTYRPANSAGAGDLITVTLTVVPPTTVQPPTAFRVDDLEGNRVTLRWNPPRSGPAPTGYLVEGGVTPGSTLGIIPSSTVPYLNFMAPSGSFFLRVKSLDGAVVSAASNEVALHVNVPVPPTAPTHLTGVATGNTFALSWKLSYGGGEPTGVVVDVSGAATASIPVGLAESFTFNGVPGGAYNFAVRAINAGGISEPSAFALLTFPALCSGAPASPTNFLFFTVGSTVFLVWDPPPNGAAPTAYRLNVTGAFIGAVPVGNTRSLSAAIPSGFYSVSVTATNPCGSSPPTAVQTVFVP